LQKKNPAGAHEYMAATIDIIINCLLEYIGTNASRVFSLKAKLIVLYYTDDGF